MVRIKATKRSAISDTSRITCDHNLRKSLKPLPRMVPERRADINEDINFHDAVFSFVNLGYRVTLIG